MGGLNLKLKLNQISFRLRAWMLQTFIEWRLVVIGYCIICHICHIVKYNICVLYVHYMYTYVIDMCTLKKEIDLHKIFVWWWEGGYGYYPLNQQECHLDLQCVSNPPPRTHTQSQFSKEYHFHHRSTNWVRVIRENDRRMSPIELGGEGRGNCYDGESFTLAQIGDRSFIWTFYLLFV